MASKGKKNYVDDSQESGVILKLINPLDKSSVKEKTLSESCSGHRLSQTGPKALSGHRKHRHGHIEKHKKKAERIQSDPCSSILETTRLHKHELDTSMKRKRMVVSKPILEHYEGVPQERLISNKNGELLKILNSSTVNSVNQNKSATGTFMNKILTKYSNRNRTHLIRLNPFAKRSFYAMNFKVQQRRRKGHKLEPYECEPGVCVPGQCDPHECRKRIMRRFVRKASTMTGRTSQSAFSETDRYHPDLRSKQQQFGGGRYAAKPKVGFETHGLKYETLPQKPAVVRIGSNISFNIEFSKSTVDSNKERKGSSGTIESYRRRQSSTGSGTEYDGNHYRTKGIQDYMSRNQDKQSQSNTTMHHKRSSITPRHKRCFCTLKLQKRGKQHKGIDFQITENPRVNVNRVSYGTENPNFVTNPHYIDGYNTTRSYKLEPYECEPGVCTPGLCDPYECEMRIKRRLRREFGTATQEHHARSTTTGARRGKRLKDRDAQSIQTYDDRPPMNRHYGTGNLESSIDRNQADNNIPGVRIGSTISFNVEFYKRDESPSQAVGYPNASLTGNERGQGTVSRINRGVTGYPHRRRSQGVTGHPTRRVHRRSQYDGQRKHSRASGVGPLLKRCFCTLKLQKYEKQEQVNNPIRNRDMSVATTTEREYDPILYREMATKTRRMYSPLEPYECEPGTCVPGYCNPSECYERIQRRNLRTAGTRTREYPTKSTSMLTGQRRANNMRKIQTPNVNNCEAKTLKSYAPMDREPQNNQGPRVVSNMSIKIEFYKKNVSPNYMTGIKSNDSTETLRLHDKHGNTNIYKKRLSQKYTDTQRRSSDSETQSRLVTNNKASAAGKALKRCFCTARFHHPGRGYMKKRAITVGRIDKIQALSPFKPTHYCVPECTKQEPCKCITEIKVSKGTKLNEKYLKDNHSQHNNTKTPKMKKKTTDSDNVNKGSVLKETTNKGAVIMLHKKSKQKENHSPVKILIQKGTNLNEKHLQNNNNSRRNNNKPPKVKIGKVINNVDKQSVQKAAEIECNAVLSKIKLKLKHYFDLCTTWSTQPCIKPYTIVEISGNELNKSISELKDLKKQTTVVMVGGADVDCKSSQVSKSTTEDKKQKTSKTKLDSCIPIKYKCDETCSYCKFSKVKKKKRRNNQRSRSGSSLLSQIKTEICKCLREKTQDCKLNKNHLKTIISSQMHPKPPKIHIEKEMDKKNTANEYAVIKPHKKSKKTKIEIPEKIQKNLMDRMQHRTFKLSGNSEKDLENNISQQSATKSTERNPVVSEVILKLKQLLNLCPKQPTPFMVRPYTVVEISGDELTKHISTLNDRSLEEPTTVVMVGGSDPDCKISQGIRYPTEDAKQKKSKNILDSCIKYKCCDTCLLYKTGNTEGTKQNTNEMETILPYASDKYQKGKSKTLLKSKKLNSAPVDPQEVNNINLTPKRENITITKKHTLFSIHKLSKPFSGIKNKQNGDAGQNRKKIKNDTGKSNNGKLNKLIENYKITEPVILPDDSYTIAEVSGNKVAKRVCFSKDPTNPEAVIVTGIDVSCKISKADGTLHYQHQQNLTDKKDSSDKKEKDKNRHPCSCGSSICAKESKKRKDTPIRKVQNKPIRKPCECGNPVCKRAVSILENYQAIKSILNPRAAPPIPLSKSELREKRKFERKRKKVDAIRNKKRQAEYLKGLKKRQKLYKKKDKERLQQRLKDDVEMLKQIRKYRNTSDSLLLTESLFDIAKLGCTAVQDVARSTYRAVIDPKHSYENLKILATDANRALGLCKRSIQESGVISTLQRVKMRLTAMKRFKRAKKTLEKSPVTRYMVHIADTDPKARMKHLKKKKKKKLKKREPMDFNCSLYMATLRKRPYLSIYYMCPWFYPHCLSLLNVWRQLSDIAIFLLAMVVWSPCILLMEACRALLCCTVCTG